MSTSIEELFPNQTRDKAELILCPCAPHHWGGIFKNGQLLAPEFRDSETGLQVIENCFNIHAITEAEALECRSKLEGITWAANKDTGVVNLGELINGLIKTLDIKPFEIKYHVLTSGAKIGVLYIGGAAVSRFMSRSEALRELALNASFLIDDDILNPDEIKRLRHLLESADLPISVSQQDRMKLLETEFDNMVRRNPLGAQEAARLMGRPDLAAMAEAFINQQGPDKTIN